MKKLINKITTGDAKELTKLISDESIDLIFTDPVYDRIEDYEWLAKEAKRILKPGGSLLAFTSHTRTIECGKIISDHLDECPLLIAGYQSSGAIPRLFKYSLQVNCLPVLWFSKGTPIARWQHILAESYILKGTRGHKWGKNLGIIIYRIERLCPNDGLVFDPYSGGGTIPSACKMLSRNYIAFEIDPETADIARERVLNTQTPLFVLELEQLKLDEK